MNVALAKAEATALVDAVQMLLAAMAASDQNNQECQLIVERVMNTAPILRDLLKEAKHFEDKELIESMVCTLRLAVKAVRDATMVVYLWLAKPSYQRIGVALKNQPALHNARERLDSQMNNITALQTQRICRHAVKMVPLAEVYEDITLVFEGLLSGNKLEVSRDQTIARANAQIKQASEWGQCLRGHTSSVASIALSSDSSRVATGSWDHTGAIWDAATGERKLVLEGHTQGVWAIAWSPDSSRVATASWDGTGAIWDTSTGERQSVLEGYTQGVWSNACSPNSSRMATASQDKTMATWDAPTGERRFVVEGHTQGVSTIAWSPDSSRVATGSWDHTGAIWDAATGQRKFMLVGHTDFVNSIAWSPDGFRVATASWDHTGAIWDAATGERIFVLKGHTQGVWSIAWSHDSLRVATASGDKTGAT